MDALGWLRKQLLEANPDLLHEMVKAFAETVMGAEADVLCGADYGQRSDERVNQRNGYRTRPWDTRAGTISLAVPKLREGSYFPDWLLRATSAGRTGFHRGGCRVLRAGRIYPTHRADHRRDRACRLRGTLGRGAGPLRLSARPQDQADPPHEPQATVVRRIFAMYTEGRVGAESIAKVLNAEGHRTKNGVAFARPIVLSILQNPIYAGSVEFRGRIHPGLHEAVVDPGSFEEAARILAERGESQALKRAHPTDFLLSGVVRCVRCRRAYVGTSAHGRNGLYRYYVCSTRYRYGTRFCPGERLPKDALEEAVIDQITDVYRDSSLIREALERARADERGPIVEAAARLASVRHELAGAKRALDRYFAAFEEGSLSAADCQDRVAGLKVKLDALQAEEASLALKASDEEREPSSAVDVAAWAKDLGVLLRAGSAQQRKALLRLLMKELRVMSREEIVPTYKIPALVRAPEGQVDPRGLEPLTSWLPAKRSTS